MDSIHRDANCLVGFISRTSYLWVSSVYYRTMSKFSFFFLPDRDRPDKYVWFFVIFFPHFCFHFTSFLWNSSAILTLVSVCHRSIRFVWFACIIKSLQLLQFKWWIRSNNKERTIKKYITSVFHCLWMKSAQNNEMELVQPFITSVWFFFFSCKQGMTT